MMWNDHQTWGKNYGVTVLSCQKCTLYFYITILPVQNMLILKKALLFLSVASTALCFIFLALGWKQKPIVCMSILIWNDTNPSMIGASYWQKFKTMYSCAYMCVRHISMQYWNVSWHGVGDSWLGGDAPLCTSDSDRTETENWLEIKILSKLLRVESLSAQPGDRWLDSWHLWVSLGNSIILLGKCCVTLTCICVIWQADGCM